MGFESAAYSKQTQTGQPLMGMSASKTCFGQEKSTWGVAQESGLADVLVAPGELRAQFSLQTAKLRNEVSSSCCTVQEVNWLDTLWRGKCHCMRVMDSRELIWKDLSMSECWHKILHYAEETGRKRKFKLLEWSAQQLLKGGKRCSFHRVSEAVCKAASLRTRVTVVCTAVLQWERE